MDSDDRENVFAQTMGQLEQALRVRHIATFRLVTCQEGEEYTAILAECHEYDQFPVKRDGAVIGVVEREQSGEALGYSFRPLDESILVSADEPLLKFVPLMANQPFYRLVLDGTRLDGIVTRSDLLKLPVRVLAFTRVTHLEALMANLIRQNYEDDSWMAELKTKRQRELKSIQCRLRKERSDPDLLELTGFPDKWKILAKGLGDEFKRDLDKITKLRNDIAHTKNYAPDVASLNTFVRRLQLADRWIDELSGRLSLSPVDS